MKRRIDFLVMALFAVLLLTSCERVAPNYAGVLMENFGKQGKEDFKISEYYRKDYAGVHILYTVLWVTIGYIAVWAIAMIAGLDTLMEKMSTALLITLVLAAVVGYVVVLVSYIGIASHLYNKKHQEARQRVKRYNHILTRLLKMYEKETK